MKSSQGHEARTARRKKRLRRKNGDRQFFVAVRKIRRDKIDKWQLKEKPKRFTQRLTQLSLQATKRQMKQSLRDAQKTGANDA